MRTPSRGLRLLLCGALLGVLVLLGLVVAAAAGVVGVVTYALLAAALVVVAVVRGRAAYAPTPLPPRTCTCCTTTHFDPVEII